MGLILKCYFRVCRMFDSPLRTYQLLCTFIAIQVKRISLAKNILRAIDANPDIPPLSQYPRSHQVSLDSSMIKLGLTLTLRSRTGIISGCLASSMKTLRRSVPTCTDYHG